MTLTRKQLTIAIQTARGIQEMARRGNLPRSCCELDPFNDAEHFITVCEDLLDAMPAPEPESADRADWSKHKKSALFCSLSASLQPHGSVLGKEHMPASVKRPAPEREASDAE